MHSVHGPDRFTPPALCCAGFAQTLGRGLWLLTCHSEAQRPWIPGAALPCRWPGQCHSGPSYHTPGQTGERRNRCFAIPSSKDVNPHSMHRAHKKPFGHSVGLLSHALEPAGVCLIQPNQPRTASWSENFALGGPGDRSSLLASCQTT